MTRRELEPARVRRELRLTQGELAALLGVHPLTVSKWERRKLTIGPYHAALVGAFGEAGAAVARQAVAALASEGIVAALRLLLAGELARLPVEVLEGELELEEELEELGGFWFGRGELEGGDDGQA